MDYSDYTFLDVNVTNSVAYITLNRPERNNAFDGSGHREMSQVLRRIQQDQDVRAAVISGAGGTFSVGPDRDRVAEIASGDPIAAYRSLSEVREIVQSAIDCDVPVVSAISGAARGSALTFALLADVIILERDVTLSDTHIRGASTAGDGGVLTWPLAMGLVRAKSYLLTGDPLPAEEAFRLGLVTELADRGTSLDRASAIAERWSVAPPLPLRMTKRALNQWLRAGAMTAFDLSAAFEQLTLLLPDAQRALEQILADDGRSAHRDGDSQS